MNLICAEFKRTDLTGESLIATDLANAYTSLKTDRNAIFVLRTCHRFLLLTHNECKLNLDQYFVQQAFPTDSITYTYGEDAIDYIFETITGLHSPIFGENEILGQFKNAHTHAQSLRALDPFLDELLRTAIKIGKKTRSETALGSLCDSYPSLSYQLIQRHLSNSEDTKILLLGTGDLGKQMLNFLQTKNHKNLWIASRSLSRAQEFADGKATPLLMAQAIEQIADFDIVIGITEVMEPLVRAEHLPDDGQNRIFIDLGIPHNFEPNLCTHPHLNLYNLNHLKTASATNMAARLQVIPDVLAIHENSKQDFIYWFNARKIVPVIQSFNKKASKIKEEEYQWVINKLGHLDDQQKVIVQKLIHRIVSKMSSQPIEQIKNYAQEEQTYKVHIDAFKEIFDIN